VNSRVAAGRPEAPCMSLNPAPPPQAGRHAGTPAADRVHRLHWFAGRLHQVLDEVGSPATWSMTAGEVTETLAELSAGIARLQGLFLGLVADADRTDLAAGEGAVNTAALVGSLTRASGPVASRTVRTARALDAHP
jgi:hypothetical protein